MDVSLLPAQVAVPDVIVLVTVAAKKKLFNFYWLIYMPKIRFNNNNVILFFCLFVVFSICTCQSARF